MEMADYWILEKDLVPKLFQVLVPRYEDKLGPYTLVHKLTPEYPGRGIKKIVMELKDNPLPPIPTEQRTFEHSLTNVLLKALKDSYKAK
jgi:large subunit ribosomal protein L17